MSKPFFFRIDLVELLDFATEPEGESMSLLKFAKELKSGKSDYSAIQKIIDEANNYIEKKKKSGSSGGKARVINAQAKSSDAQAVLKQKVAVLKPETETETIIKDKTIFPSYGDKPVKKEKTLSSPTPYEEILNLYHQVCPNLPRVKVLTESRKNKVAARWKQFGQSMESFRECFSLSAASSFLNGGNDRKWTASFDWFFENDKNMVKVLEGKYADKDTYNPMAGVV